MLFEGTITRTTALRPTPSTRAMGTGPTLATGASVRVMASEQVSSTSWHFVVAGARDGWLKASSVKKRPMLLVDIYWNDLGARPPFEAVAAQPGYAGAIIKATEGTSYAKAHWFETNWSRVRDAARERYGTSWFRGCYHFLTFAKSGAAQADYYVRTIERAGGFDHGDLLPIVDVELGGPSNSNQRATARQIIDVTTAFANRVTSLTGRAVTLYGNGAMRDRGIRNRMGCDWLWIPRYTATLPRSMYERAGWTLDRVWGWQYCGGGDGALAHYPRTVPGFGAVDISVILLPSLNEVREKICR